MTHRSNPRFKTHLPLMCLLVLALASPVSAEWKEKVLYSFQGGTDGAVPTGAVVLDQAGNLYGVTNQGGAANCSPIAYCGTVFQLAPPVKSGDPWTETVLYIFKGKKFNDGEYPEGGLVSDAAGNLYGTTGYGGAGDCVLLGILGGCGTVFELSPPQQKGGAWKETILYSFPTAKQGYVPAGDLVFDGAGNLYGATLFGGTKGTTCDAFYGGQCGVVFELSPLKAKPGRWTEQVLHNFAGGTDGANPNGGLVLDSEGAIYGTTASGGNQGCKSDSGIGCGTVFELNPPTETSGTWTEKMLHRFTGGNDGAGPNGGLIFGNNGLLYGTGGGGGSGNGFGVVFHLAHAKNGFWNETVLYSFQGGADGRDPSGPVTLDSSGNLYGTTNAEGSHFGGTFFRLRPPGGSRRKWSFALLYSFTGPPDAEFPAARLIFGKADILYSTTQNGGTGQVCQGGCGTVFEVSP